VDAIFGFGLTGIRLVRGDLPKEDDGRPFVFSGVDGNWTIVNRVSRRVYEGVFDEETTAWGVVSAAGPAAERKLRLAMGLPPGMKAYVRGDHRPSSGGPQRGSTAAPIAKRCGAERKPR
jgi:hypothetical protein